LDNEKGKIKWFYNASTAPYPMFGGTAAPLIDKNQVFWVSNYALPNYPLNGGKWGLVFHPDSNINLECDDYNFLYAKTFDNGKNIINAWKQNEQFDQTWSVKINHVNYTAKYHVNLSENKFMFSSPLKESGTALYRYISVKFFNQNTYELKYLDVNTMNTYTTHMTAI
jgi:hypothetical protein